jgi:hypothetical protein
MLGRNCLSCQIPGGLLNGGQYYVAIRIGRCLRKSIEWVVDLDAAVSFDMEFDHGVARAWLNTRSQKGIVAPLLNWTALPTYPGDPSHSDRATCGGPAVDACAASHHESNGALPRR